MPYRTADELSTYLGSAYRRLKPALEQFGAQVDSPSGDGYLIRVELDKHQVVFSVEGLPINTASAHLLARDKLATYQLLEAGDVRVPCGLPVFDASYRGLPSRVDEGLQLSNIERALRRTFGDISEESLFIVKPSRESHAVGVNLCRGLQSVHPAVVDALRYGRCAIVQEFVPGIEYRVVLLDDDVLVKYRKHNPSLFGDGASTERQLIDAFNVRLRRTPEDPPILNPSDLPPLQGGKRWSLDGVPPKGEILELALETQNLSHGAWPEILEDLPGDILDVCWQAHSLLGLSYSGIDIRLASGERNAVVLEVNGNPGFTFLERYAPELVKEVAHRLAERIVSIVRASPEQPDMR